jgi:hypothetical protein
MLDTGLDASKITVSPYVDPGLSDNACYPSSASSASSSIGVILEEA